MDDKLNKIKYDKMLLELKYLEADIEYTKQVIAKNTRSFERCTRGTARNQGVWQEIEERRAKASSKGPPPQQKKKKKRIRKKDKELFKKIAKEAHPDKLIHLSEEERDRKQEKFLKASTALQGGSPEEIRQIAKDLGIDPGPVSEEDMESVEEKIEEMNKIMSTLKESVIWVWSQKEDKEEKQQIIEMYIRFLLTTLPQ